MKPKRVVCVGGAGFIGSKLAQYLDSYTNVDLKYGKDFCDPVINGLVQDADVVVFLAADLEQTKRAYRYNLRLYEALSRLERPHIIFTSSAAVYRPSPSKHLEEEELRPETIYGRSKLLGERIIQDLFTDYTILRLSNVYGDGDGHGVIDIFRKGGKIIYGNGEQVRDYIYVGKVASAIAKIVKHPENHSKKIYNISSGRGRTVNEIFKEYGNGELMFRPGRSFDVPYSVLDNTVATVKGLL